MLLPVDSNVVKSSKVINTRTTMEIDEYVGRTYKNRMDTQLSIENMSIVNFELPEDHPVDSMRTEVKCWEKGLITMHYKRQRKSKTSMQLCQ